MRDVPPEPAPRETEIKLDLDPADAAAVLALPGLGDGEGDAPEPLVTTYYDTPGGDLREAGYTLRVRQAGGGFRQTLKRSGAGAGLFSRDEWECDLPDAAPDPSALPGTPLVDLVGEAAALSPLFTLRTDRMTRRLARGDTRIEAAFDRGAVELPDGATSRPFAELELELRSGSARDLFGLARDLAEAAPLRLGITTKAERGFATLDGPGPRIRKAGRVALARSMTSADAFQAVARACLVHLRHNEPLVLAERDAEALHQVRVAIRRLRSAISLFKPVVGDPATLHMRDVLKERIAVLGEARNLDVLLMETLPAEMERRPEAAAAFVALRARLEAERAKAYDGVLALLRSAEWRGLVIDVAALVEDGTWLTDRALATARERLVESFAAEVLEKRRRRVRRRGRHLAQLGAGARHAVRIEAKKLRYGAEFFASLAEGGKGRRRQAAFVEALSDLQDALGALNDVTTARDMLIAAAERSKAAGEGGAAFAAGLFTADREHDADAGEALAAYRRFAEAKRFWQKP